MTYTFQDRYIPDYTGAIPLAPGKYKFKNDFYECERSPRVGETASEYTNYARQCGILIRTTYENFKVD